MWSSKFILALGKLFTNFCINLDRNSFLLGKGKCSEEVRKKTLSLDYNLWLAVAL